MRDYLEWNGQTFVDMQARLMEQSKAVFEKMQQQMNLPGALSPGMPGITTTKK